MKQNKKLQFSFRNLTGFTLIEIIVVVTIIGVLLTGGVVSYTSLNKSSRDARRKSDLEQIRAALEMYRSSNNFYPVFLNDLTDPVKYLETVPTDPKISTGYVYQFIPSPPDCDNTATFCSGYIIYALMEGTSACQDAADNSISCLEDPLTLCNYCAGPYGQKQ